MLKKILISLAATVAGAYMILALVCFTERPTDVPCKGIDVTIHGNEYGILDTEDIISLLKSKQLEPTGKPLNKISCDEIEKAIKASSLIEDCQCFKTHRDLIGMRIVCKTPILQAFDNEGKEFFIDKHGSIIKGIPGAMYLPVASGNIDRQTDCEELLKLALFLQDNNFWREQTEQIFFTHKKEIIIVPRVGNHTIELGTTDNMESKLAKLKKFYKKGLNKIGWNKYEKLNIEFDNQIICTKRD